MVPTLTTNMRSVSVVLVTEWCIIVYGSVICMNTVFTSPHCHNNIQLLILVMVHLVWMKHKVQNPCKHFTTAFSQWPSCISIATQHKLCIMHHISSSQRHHYNRTHSELIKLNKAESTTHFAVYSDGQYYWNYQYFLLSACIEGFHCTLHMSRKITSGQLPPKFEGGVAEAIQLHLRA